MTTRTLPLIASLGLLAAGCYGLPSSHVPTLDEVSSDADVVVQLIDRDLVLADAQDGLLGPAIELDSAPGAFYLDVGAEEDMAEVEEGTDGEDSAPPTESQANYLAAVGAVLIADAATLLVVGPPATAIAVATSGKVVEVAPGVARATNSVAVDGQTATVTFTAAWVGVGWLAEMRLSTADGVYNDALWFNGFLADGGGLGWWDLYDGHGTLQGVVEWIDDGVGNSELGIAALDGEVAGDTLSYWFDASGEILVAHTDFSEGVDSWVHQQADGSGDLQLGDYNGGELACWDVDLLNCVCE